MFMGTRMKACSLFFLCCSELNMRPATAQRQIFVTSVKSLHFPPTLLHSASLAFLMFSLATHERNKGEWAVFSRSRIKGADRNAIFNNIF